MELVEIDHAVCVTPPRLIIDLSLPPRERYKTLAQARAAQLRSLTSLYDDLLLGSNIPEKWLKHVHRLSRIFLRRVYDSEETQELKGIAEVSGVPMYLLIAFNVLLDLLMGCTSGGVRTRENGHPPTSAKMLHFRTLDWGMDPLRKIIVQLDFVRSKSPQPNRIIASSVTYVGFVGVLTGVKPGLSLSLNFRAVHDANTKKEHFRFYLHHLLVLLGRRPSIANILRHQLIGHNSSLIPDQQSLESVVADIMGRHTTAAYLIFSDGQLTMTIEKDYSTSLVNRSDAFIVRTNHDVDDHKKELKPVPAVSKKGKHVTRAVGGLEGLFAESRERFGCITKQYEAKMKLANTSRRRHAKRQRQAATAVEGEPNLLPTKAEIVQWLCTWTTTNECTHYAVVMDPELGEVVWCKAYPQPLSEPHRGSREWSAVGPRNRKKQWVSIATEDLL